MPRGPLPKADEKRERRNEPTFETTELTGHTVKRPSLPNRRKLSPSTRRWWDTWASSPQSEHFLSTDWQRLLVLVPTVEAYFAGDLSRLAEIRMNEGKLGATPEDRLRLRWRLRDAKAAEEQAEKKAAKPAKRRSDPRLKLVEAGS